MKQNRKNVAAGFATVLSFLALATFAQAQSTGTGCIPNPKWDFSVPTPPANSGQVAAGTDDTTNNGGVYVPNDGSADNGSMITLKSGLVIVGATGLDMKSEVNAFVWAEDGDSILRTFSTTISRTHTFKTECIPLEGHGTPPNGNSIHRVTARGEMSYELGATGGAASRTADITLQATLPTGQSIKHEIKLTSGSAASHENTISFGGAGSVGQESESSVKSGDEVGSALQSSMKGNKGASGTYTVTKKLTWKDNESASESDSLPFQQRSEYTPSCHTDGDTGEESPKINGSISITADDPVASITLHAIVTTSVLDVHEPKEKCLPVTGPVTGGGGPRNGSGTGGGTGPTTPGGGPSTGGSGGGTGGTGPITPGGGSGSSDGFDPVSVGGSATTSQSVVMGGRPTRASIFAEASAPLGAGIAIFDVRVPATVGSATLYFRVAADSLTRIAMGLAATVENSAVGAALAPTSFDPSVGTTVGAGVWTIRIPVNCAATGQSKVEMSTTSNFAGGTVSSVNMEVVQESFSMDAWGPGVHLGTSLLSNVLQGSAPEQRFYIDSLLSSSAALGTPTMTYSVRNGAAINWGIVPTLGYDAFQGRYYVTMVPLGPAIVDVTITANGHSIVCPVEWKVGVPNSL